MRIKHWQGYGCVNAKVVRTTHIYAPERFGDLTELEIEVWGNHEYGIESYDEFTVFNWLKRFFIKYGIEDYSQIEKMEVNDFYKENNEKHISEEHCIYTFYF